MYRNLLLHLFAVLAFVSAVWSDDIFSCNFNANNCSITTKLTNSEVTSVNVANKAEYGGKAYTDYSSISELTANTYPCEIPYTIDNDKKYFCTKDLTCKTKKNSEVAACQKGKFLFIQNIKNDQAVEFTIEFQAQEVKIPGQYQLNLFYFADCIADKPELCKDLKDLFEIRITAGKQLDPRIVHLDDGLKNPGWHAVSYTFNTTEKFQEVTLKIRNDLSPLDAGVVYGIDNIEIKSVQQESTTTPEPSTTTVSVTVPIESPSTSAPSTAAPVTTQTVTVSPTATGSSATNSTTPKVTTTKQPTTTTTTSGSSGLGSFSSTGFIVIALTAVRALFN